MTVPPTSSTPEYAIRGWGLGLSQSRQDPMLFAVQNGEPLGATPGFSAALKVARRRFAAHTAIAPGQGPVSVKRRARRDQAAPCYQPTESSPVGGDA
jgi:hypothetical protein